MIKKATVLLLASALLLSACGKNNDSEKNASESNSTNVTKPSTAEPSKDKPADQTTATNETTEPPQQDPPTEESTKDAVIEKKYHMNKVYNIVPNDEGTAKKVVLLTFDDGPKKAEMINSLIDTLDKHHAKAIFFVNGYRVKENPDLLKLIHDRDQIIGNHSWDHISLRKEPEAKVKKQIEDVQNIVKDTIGETPVFFRPPFGEGGDVGKKIAKENGLLYMTWSNGSLDWTLKSKGTDNPNKVISNVLDQLHAGSNILMHELPWTVEALDTLLTKLEGKGYSFVDPRSIELEMR
ncbi:polysaccharide deacetylase family protein [Paenibacillus pini]|uniref:Peptidoglycan N-acetylglucosamine deacetylase n=1 Tax=Paenibacillus pini JCM 16418 TaxID=1236976 RepID=W7YDL2_9BACL|nr:polysaccharide deacetylase family protein [Paenibacillus pini]GAF09025.1 peptidoglycan N-acetylglucosamine deacetylase [Paenibacillus pini JCM 16418]